MPYAWLQVGVCKRNLYILGSRTYVRYGRTPKRLVEKSSTTNNNKRKKNEAREPKSLPHHQGRREGCVDSEQVINVLPSSHPPLFVFNDHDNSRWSRSRNTNNNNNTDNITLGEPQPQQPPWGWSYSRRVLGTFFLTTHGGPTQSCPSTTSPSQ